LRFLSPIGLVLILVAAGVEARQPQPIWRNEAISSPGGRMTSFRQIEANCRNARVWQLQEETSQHLTVRLGLEKRQLEKAIGAASRRKKECGNRSHQIRHP
jgi:hypothetical protein